MGADASIYSMIRPPQAAAGPLDQYAQAMTVRNLMQGGQLQDMQLRQAQKGMEEDEAVSAAYAASKGNPEMLRDLLYGRGLYKQATAAEKAGLERKIQLTGLEKTEGEVNAAKVKDARDSLSGVRDQATYDQWRQYATQKGYRIATQAPSMFDPKWQQSQLMTADGYLERAVPKPPSGHSMLPDGSLGPIDPEYLKGRTAVAAAGAPKVNVNTEKTFLGKVADVVGERIGTASGAAQTSLQTIDTANRLRDAIATGNVMTGPGATLKVAGAQLAQSMGFGDSPEALVQTRQAIKGLAELALSARASLKGQGQISDYEGKLLQRASTGDIDQLTAPEIKTLADLADRAARLTIQQNRKHADSLRKNPNAASMADFLDVEEPAPYQPAPATPKPPQGLSQKDIDTELRRRGVIK